LLKLAISLAWSYGPIGLGHLQEELASLAARMEKQMEQQGVWDSRFWSWISAAK